MAQAT